MDYVRTAIDWFVSLNSLVIIGLLIIAFLAGIARWAWSWIKRPLKR